jgi:hypothetical protein
VVIEVLNARYTINNVSLLLKKQTASCEATKLLVCVVFVRVSLKLPLGKRLYSDSKHTLCLAFYQKTDLFLFLSSSLHVLRNYLRLGVCVSHILRSVFCGFVILFRLVNHYHDS